MAEVPLRTGEEVDFDLFGPEPDGQATFPVGPQLPSAAAGSLTQVQTQVQPRFRF